MPVLIEFLNLERAKAWYGSDQYKELKELRLSATKADAVFIESGPNEFDGSSLTFASAGDLLTSLAVNKWRIAACNFSKW